MAKHKHAELIKAWADGARVQYLRDATLRDHWCDCPCPIWDVLTEYRIKPEPKPDIVEIRQIGYNIVFCSINLYGGSANCHPNVNAVPVKFIFDGETGALKKVEIV